MLVISGYRITETLHLGSRVSVYRAIRLEDGAAVVIKSLARPHEDTTFGAGFRREFEIGRRIRGPGIVPVLGIEPTRHGQILILADSGGLSLAVVRRSEAPSLVETLGIGASVAAALGNIHRARVIHKDINPANIVWNRRSGQVELIDFGIAAELERETALGEHKPLEGTLPYIAPEQTGRMNRSVDWRSDFYALGATLYDLLTGRPPFEGDDALAVIHGHIARAPHPPHLIDPAIPPMVSAIVLKLLAKDPEQRYQSAYGIRVDLETCLEALATKGTVSEFPIAFQDVSPWFHIPEKLYGRAADLEGLLGCFEQVASGAARLVLVAGPAGIGKSALVQEFRRLLIARPGTFVHGKYDQFRRNVPYSALVQAFGALARRLLAEPEEVLADARQALAAAVGGNGAVVTELIPEFALILGPQPLVSALSPSGSEFRFQITFQNLVVALATADRPLVIFLDDLQWADRSSLVLLGKLIRDPEMRHLLILGSYRPEEVDELHPLTRTVAEIVSAGVPVDTITVGALTAAHVQTLVAEAMRRDEADVASLAARCFDKTEGNPFFLIQFLLALRDDGLIALDHRAGRWTWDAAAIDRRDSTANVVDLMIGKIRRLDQETVRVLSLAACVGNRFDLGTLAVAASSSIERLAAALWPALEEGLILPLDGNYRYLGFGADGEPHVEDGGDLVAALKVDYHFLHDRVQQAAYTLINEQDRAATHLRIGRLLLAVTPEGEREERLFDIVDHLNRGCAGITDQAEREMIGLLDLEAAGRARAAAAFEAALAYADAGLALMGEAAWNTAYDAVLALHVEAADSAAMMDDHPLMERYAQAALAQTQSAVDAAQIQMIRLTACAARGDPAAATAIGLQALAALGVRLPPVLGSRRLRFEIWRGRLALVVARVRARSQDIDPARTAAARVLMAMITVAIISRSDLLVPIAVRLLEVALPARDPGIASLAYLAWAMICSVTGDPGGAVATSGRALDLVDHDALRGRSVRVVVMANYAGQHWAVPAAALRQRYADLYHVALGAGDREYAIYGLAFGQRTGWQTGLPLALLKVELDETARTLTRLGTTPYTAYIAGLRQAVQTLELGDAAPEVLNGAFLCEETVFPALIAARFMIIVVNLLTVKLLLALVFGRAVEARALADTLEKEEHFLAGYSSQPVSMYLRALAICAGPFASPQARRDAQSRVRRALRLLEASADVGPLNHRHRWLLLRAEAARLSGAITAAVPLYEAAVATASDSGHLHEEALANERAADFYHAQGYTTQERAYRTQGRDAYRRWGAAAKVRMMEQHYPDLVAVADGGRGDDGVPATSTHRFVPGALDVAALLKAALAISGEIRLDALLETLMRTVLHNAGAERCVLALMGADGGPLTLAAEGNAALDRFVLLPGLPLEACDSQGIPRLPAAVVCFTVRSREAVVLADAAGDPRFTADPYVRLREPRSVLSLPLMRQNQLVGVLYLENNLATNVFSGGRLEGSRLLAAQIAISLENARLYDNLQDFNRALESQVFERTRALQTALDGERLAHEQLRSAQAQLVQSEKLASLGQMVAGVAHEINTPVGIALTAASMLVDRTDVVHTHFSAGRLRRSEAEEYFEVANESSRLILSNVQRAARLVQSFKQVAVDRISEQHRAFDLARWLDDLVFSLGPAWGQAGHSVEVVCPAGIEIDGNADVLAQILTNLVMNSLHHGYEPGQRGGHLVVRVTRPSLDWVEISYADDGKGIPEANRKKVFDPFFTTRRSAGSTGLGMHIVFTLVTARLGGEIILDERGGVGTCWIIRFPHLMPVAPSS